MSASRTPWDHLEFLHPTCLFIEYFKDNVQILHSGYRPVLETEINTKHDWKDPEGCFFNETGAYSLHGIKKLICIYISSASIKQHFSSV